MNRVNAAEGRYCGSATRSFGTRDRAQRCGLGHLLHRRGGDRAVAGQIARLVAAALDGGGFGDHVDHHRGRRRLIGRPPGSPVSRTCTASIVAPRRQRRQRIGAALGLGARIIRAHRGRKGIRVSHRRPLHLGPRTSPQISAVPFLPGRTSIWRSSIALLGHPHRVGVGSMTIQSTSSVTLSRESLFHAGALAASCASIVGQHVGVVDQVGAIDRRRDHPKVDPAGQEHLGRVWGTAPAASCRSASATTPGHG